MKEHTMKIIRIVGLTTCMVLVGILLVRSFTADADFGLGKWEDDGTCVVLVSTNDGPAVTISTNRNILIGGYWFTNLVISNTYSGTIQIGTNFATVKELDTWVTVLSSMKRTTEIWPAITNQNPLAAFTEYRRFTYTVNVADGLWTHTNVIEIEKCSDFCTRLRYVDGDVTNDFHAAFASFTVKTNSP